LQTFLMSFRKAIWELVIKPPLHGLEALFADNWERVACFVWHFIM